MIDVGVVRVFADAQGAHGNELGIVWDQPAAAGREQAIAAELGFSETVFAGIGERTAEGLVVRTRIFTPAVELPFAGHPTVGLAWWAARAHGPVAAIATPAGRVPVAAEPPLTFVRARPEWMPDFRWVELASPAEVDALEPGAFPSGQHYCWAWSDETAGRIRARMFAPEFGIAEDEATGSAAIGITAVLRRSLEIEQGAGSRLSTRWSGPDELVAVGGRVVADRRIALG